MKVNLGISAHNSNDWERVLANDLSRPPAVPDADFVEAGLALGELAEPLGFDGIWAAEHFSTPYSLTPNPLQALSYLAGRTETISFGTIVAVLPWWNPVRLAHQIAYLDIVSKGRYDMIGVGRGVSKFEYDAVGIARDESRGRFEEGLDILELALTEERFSYQGHYYQIPDASIRPQPRSRDLVSRLHAASSTGTSLEAVARRGLRPLFVGNKPLSEAAKDLRTANAIRREIDLPPCQSKNILMMYCAASEAELERAMDYVASANRDAINHYGLDDPTNFKGIKGYEAYEATATAVVEEAAKPRGATAYDESTLLVGTPETIIERIIAGQKICSFSEIGIVPNLGTMPADVAEKSVRLFAREVLPVIHKLDAPLHASGLPEAAEMASSA